MRNCSKSGLGRCEAGCSAKDGLLPFYTSLHAGTGLIVNHGMAKPSNYHGCDECFSWVVNFHFICWRAGPYRVQCYLSLHFGETHQRTENIFRNNISGKTITGKIIVFHYMAKHLIKISLQSCLLAKVGKCHAVMSRCSQFTLEDGWEYHEPLHRLLYQPSSAWWIYRMVIKDCTLSLIWCTEVWFCGLFWDFISDIYHTGCLLYFMST